MSNVCGTRPRPAWPGAPPQIVRTCAERDPSVSGFTLIELLFTIAALAVLVGMAIPIGGDAVDELRTAAAARYVASRIATARMDAIKRSTPVGVRFQPASSDYSFRCHADGNGNGVRTTDIVAGVDPPLGVSERLRDSFPGVWFELMPGLPDVDGVLDGRSDGVRIGTSRILTLGTDGTATSGTLYVRGRRSQYAVRVLGATGRTRVLKYDSGSRTWISH